MKKFKIEVPEGYAIDKENSSLEDGIIKFKAIETKNKNIITNLKFDPAYCKINDLWAFSVFKEEDEGEETKGEEISGHKASIFLTCGRGAWFDEDGNEIEGYLYYKPDEE